MLALLTLFFLVAVHQSSGSSDLSKLMKNHPTWSFEVKSVDSVVEEATPLFRDFLPDSSEASLRAEIRAMLPNTTHIVRKVGDPKWRKDLPTNFDARDKWPECAELLGDVDDEGVCNTDGPAVASCVARDKLCIHTKGAFKEKLSQEMLAACAEPCTKTHIMWKSFKYIYDHGIPTGGGYNSKQGCLPYIHPSCKHDNASFLDNFAAETDTTDEAKSCSEYMPYDHVCPKKCSNSKYPKSLEEDLIKFTGWYIVTDDEHAMRNEILGYGPVGAGILLYEDLLTYPEGIYRKTNGTKPMYYRKHIKLIGWGIEKGTRYWLAINGWDYWGPTKVFKLPRGNNYLGVEWYPMTGIFVEDDINKPSY